METTYNAAELAAQARTLFGTTPEAVRVALRETGRETASVTEAQTVVKNFLERKVN